MGKYAIVQIGGKQFKISEGQTFQIESQKGLKFDVLACFDGKETLIGEPFLENVKIEAEVLENTRGKKVEIGRFKSKSRYRKKKGHRQPYSMVKVKSIKLSSEEKAKASTKAEDKPVKVSRSGKKVKEVKSSKRPIGSR